MSEKLFAIDKVTEKMLRRDPCAYCGWEGGSVDHIVSRGAGGADTADNLTGTCISCNSSKAGKSLLGFLGWRITDIEGRMVWLRYESHLWGHLGRYAPRKGDR